MHVIPKVFLKIQMGKIIIYSGQQPCSTGEQTVLCFTFCYNCHLLFFPIPAFSAKGEKYLMPTVSVHVLFNETFGICKEYFVGLSKCKFLCIVMRSAYYSNFCGLNCIGLNFAPVPLWPSFLATSESRPFHPSCVIDPKQERGVNVVSYSWIKP